MASESRLWSWLAAGFPKAEVHYRMDRVESGITAGVPDVSYTINGYCNWLELKSVPTPVRDSTPVLGGKGLRLAQQNWAIRNIQAGGASYLLIGSERNKWLIRLASRAIVDEINFLSMRDLHSACSLYVYDKWSVEDWKWLARELCV